MANKKELRWTAPETYFESEEAFGEDDLAGWQILVDDAPAVSIPAAWNDEGQYSFPLASLSLSFGEHSIRMQTVATNGKVSPPSAPAVFTWNDERVPRAPLDVSVA